MCTFPPVIDERHGYYLAFKDIGGQDKYIEQYRNLTIEFAEKHSFPVADLGNFLRDEAPDRYTLPDGIHLTEEGNRKVAEEISEIMAELIQ
jgi:lysophospholipase L1-like esterase